jgi:hypothetical protein
VLFRSERGEDQKAPNTSNPKYDLSKSHRFLEKLR